MKRYLGLAASTSLLLVLGVATPQTFAASIPGTQSSTSTSSSSTTVVVAQGPGYVVTTGSPSAPKTFPIIQPMAMHTNTLAQGSSGSFTGTSTEPYSDGNLAICSYISVNDVNAFLQPSKLYASGTQYSYWTGADPYDWTQIWVTPGEQATGQNVVTSVSIPPSMTFSTNCTEATLKWPTVSPTGQYKSNFQNTYQWTQWELENNGCFTNVHTTDQATFEFGTTEYGLTNDVNVNIG